MWINKFTTSICLNFSILILFNVASRASAISPPLFDRNGMAYVKCLKTLTVYKICLYGLLWRLWASSRVKIYACNIYIRKKILVFDNDCGLTCSPYPEGCWRLTSQETEFLGLSTAQYSYSKILVACVWSIIGGRRVAFVQLITFVS